MKLDGRRMSDNVSDRRGERMNMAGGGMGLLRLLAILPGGIKTKLVGLAVVAAVVLATQGTSGLSGLFVSQTRTRCGIHITLVTTFGVVRNSHYHSIVNSEVCLDDLFTGNSDSLILIGQKTSDYKF